MNLLKTQIVTAIITPFDADNQVDYLALTKLTNYLLSHGTDGFVIGGTTGEGATMSNTEKLELYAKFVEIVANRGPVIANVGTNNTAASIEFGQKVAKIKGIDAILAVVPYYNKPDQAGMIAHFEALADNITLPVMMYNIPGRTGVTATPATILHLAKHPRIVAVKQCTELADLSMIIEHAPTDFAIFTGEDNQALAAKAMGATGVVSVVSHLYGPQMATMYAKLASGDVQGAGKIQRYLVPKVTALFSHPSPAPVKAALTAAGFATGSVRLPLVDLNLEQRNAVLSALED